MDYTTLPIPTDAGMVPEPVAVASRYEALQQLLIQGVDKANATNWR